MGILRELPERLIYALQIFASLIGVYAACMAIRETSRKAFWFLAALVSALIVAVLFFKPSTSNSSAWGIPGCRGLSSDELGLTGGGAHELNHPVEVPGDQTWVDTGIKLAEGSCFDVFAFQPTAGMNDPARIIPKSPYGSVLACGPGTTPCPSMSGRIGPGGRIFEFKIGAPTMFQAPKRGELYLRLNGSVSDSVSVQVFLPPYP